MSCYGCKRFMPVRDKKKHQIVLQDFRGIVTRFKDASRGEVKSPAYLQLARVISEVQDVIQELEAERRGNLDGEADENNE